MSSSSAGVQRALSAGGAAAEAPGARGAPSGKIALYSLVFFRWHPERPVLLSCAFDLSSFPFFHRHTVKEHILFHSRLICARTPLGRRQVVEFQERIGHCHVYVHPSGLACTVLSSAAYPMRVAFGLIAEAVKRFQDQPRYRLRQGLRSVQTHALPAPLKRTLDLKNSVQLRIPDSLAGRQAVLNLIVQAVERKGRYFGDWENVTVDQAEGTMFADEGRELLQQYQNPVEADRILKVQRGLDEVKDVMLKNIDDLLQRGEKLDDLMKRSEDLSNTSYQFYRQAKKNNQCCSWY